MLYFFCILINYSKTTLDSVPSGNIYSRFYASQHEKLQSESHSVQKKKKKKRAKHPCTKPASQRSRCYSIQFRFGNSNPGLAYECSATSASFGSCRNIQGTFPKPCLRTRTPPSPSIFFSNKKKKRNLKNFWNQIMSLEEISLWIICKM